MKTAPEGAVSADWISLLLQRYVAGANMIIDACADGMKGIVGCVEIPCCSVVEAGVIEHIIPAEIDVLILYFEGPSRADHVFDTAANAIAGCGIVEFEVCRDTVEGSLINVAIRKTAGAVDKCASGSIAKAAPHSPKPIQIVFRTTTET